MSDSQMIPAVTHSEQLADLAAALAKAQAEITAPKKSHTAHVPTKTGGSYDYSYSTLDELIEVLRVPLSKNGLSFYQHTESRDRSVGVETIILHASGQSLRTGFVTLPAGDTAQSFGSAHTYARRYSLGAAFGVCPESDDDGNEASRTSKASSSRAVNKVTGELPSAPNTGALRPSPGGACISEAQGKRLWAIAKGAGWTQDQVRVLLTRCHIEHTKDIKSADYTDIISALEAGPDASGVAA
jgi:hypothetical protein